ncbi:MAG TPA: bacteriohopanetetrol glucosamine biosynthesis glycosyltransferase HpnI [Spirochaetia bacterium]|nr:bacteriohopanetetrol glucosamine biosynthesis glycosyltransferase HpnI [Spirochaetia bacterium]
MLVQLATWMLLTASLVSIVYLGMCLWRVIAFCDYPHSEAAVPYQGPVTILKPVCGSDAQLYENLRSFCDQDYPECQVVFGVSDAGDPAVEIIERVIKEFPERDLTRVVNSRAIGANAKVSNLSNMAEAAKHDLLLVADSDMRVDRCYASTIASSFQNPGIGAVTCLYKGSPVGGLPSALGSMFINDWFLPSVLVALTFQPMRFCFGATMAVRRSALNAIGGFEALAGYLADDYMLGELVSRQGYSVLLSSYVVENIVLEESLMSLFSHELRWARTVRTVQPVGYFFSFLTNTIVLSGSYCLASRLSPVSLLPLLIALSTRILLHCVVHLKLRVPGRAAPELVPVRDVLSFAVWAASFWGRSIRWRGRDLVVQSDGRLTIDDSRRSP